MLDFGTNAHHRRFVWAADMTGSDDLGRKMLRQVAPHARARAGDDLHCQLGLGEIGIAKLASHVAQAP